MRYIYLPELLSINIKNFTLYPNGLNYKYDFVKGVNLILGGNGMGKTTFTNIIKYSIIGHYSRRYDHTRTYKEKSIEKRILHSSGYFKNRMDEKIEIDSSPCVIIEFKINKTKFRLERDLQNISLLSLFIDEVPMTGKIVDQFKYEVLEEVDKKKCLLYVYEKEIEKKSGLSFDDLILFVNDVLFFGEEHKTILWNEGYNGIDIQNELFNKYFNTPELDKERQEAQRQAKYFDSLSRHKSEDIRAIKKVLDNINNNSPSETSQTEIYTFSKEIEELESKIEILQNKRTENDYNISIYQNTINELSLKVDDLEVKRNRAEKELVDSVWESLHPLYDDFITNIKSNHICPICNKPNEKLYSFVLNNSNKCFVCGTEHGIVKNTEVKHTFDSISEKHREIHSLIQKKQQEIKILTDQNTTLDREFKEYELKKRNLQSHVRNVEFALSKKDTNNDLQAFYDEITRLSLDKEKYQNLSREQISKAESASKKIEEMIIKNTSEFSKLFASYAEKFLGVNCYLTYDSHLGGINRFYPVINGITRYSEEELSESQRFFIDHSFRMSILSFFYTKPTFYIVETPDSSLDISYEKNAAEVFLKFLENPNSVIITSNLNNSLFVNHIIESKGRTAVSIVQLLEIAKQSTIQNNSNSIFELYDSLKKKVANDDEK